LTKRKSELYNIAEALDIGDSEAKRDDLIKAIQAYLDSNETTLMNSTTFKGLYGRRHK